MRFLRKAEIITIKKKHCLAPFLRFFDCENQNHDSEQKEGSSTLVSVTRTLS